MARLITCKFCGKIHKVDFDCGHKPTRIKNNTAADRFRWSTAWKKKREQIKSRDKNLCQVCIRKLYDTVQQYTYNDIEVHHIEPIVENYYARLDDDNLITICGYHHELAEHNKIPRYELKEIAREQERLTT